MFPLIYQNDKNYGKEPRERRMHLFATSTEVEVFLDKGVRETRQAPGANSRRGATKKREISRTLLSINLHFSVHLLAWNNQRSLHYGLSL